MAKVSLLSERNYEMQVLHHHLSVGKMSLIMFLKSLTDLLSLACLADPEPTSLNEW